jgi:hypothetical protein
MYPININNGAGGGREVFLSLFRHFLRTSLKCCHENKIRIFLKQIVMQLTYKKYILPEKNSRIRIF